MTIELQQAENMIILLIIDYIKTWLYYNIVIKSQSLAAVRAVKMAYTGILYNICSMYFLCCCELTCCW